MALLIKTSNATDPKTGKVIQHALWDTGYSYQIHRWDEETGENVIVDETEYEGVAGRKAARYTAIGEMSSQHLQALHDIHGNTYVNPYGITMHWSESLGRFVTPPDRNE